MKPRAKRKKAKSIDNTEAKRKRMVIGFGAIMIFLMVFSVVSVINQSPGTEDQLKYGEYEFVLENRPNEGSVLIAIFNGQQVEFQNIPTQVGYIEVDPAAVTILRTGQQVALTADPSLPFEDLSLVDYARLQLDLAIPKMFNAMSSEDERYTLPVINCSHATMQMPVIYFNVTNETSDITTDDYCIFINAEQRDMMRLKDRLIFEYYDILRNGEVVE